MTVVNGKLNNPGAAAPGNGVIAAVLVDYDDRPVIGFDVTDQTEILSTLPIPVNTDGSWTVQLTPNAQIQTAGGAAQTAWRITESGAGTDGTYWIVVPSGGPYWAGTLRTTLSGTTPSATPANLAVAGNLTVGGTFTLDNIPLAAPPNDPARFLASDGEWRVGGGAISSVNGHTGTVVLGAGDVGALAATQNLADVANAATARTNLGLGAAAVASIGTVAGTVAAGNDSRIAGAVQASTVTAKGDLLAATATGVVSRVAVGSDGRILTADSSQVSGVAWAAPASSRDPYTAMLGLASQPYPLDATDNDNLGASAGCLILALNRPGAGLISNLGLWLQTAGTGPGAASMAVFPSTGGPQLAVTGDMSPALTSAANDDTYVEAPVGTPYMAADGVDYYYGLFTNLAADAKIAGVYGGLHIPIVKGHAPMLVITGLSAMPASLDLSGAITAAAAYWLVAS